MIQITVKKKLYLGFSLVIVLFIAVAVTNIIVQSIVSRQRSEVYNLQAAQKTAANLRYQTMAVSSTGAYYLLSNSQQEADKYFKTYSENVRDVMNGFDVIGQMTINPDSLKYLTAAKDQFDKYISGNNSAFMIYQTCLKLGKDGTTLEKDPAGVIQAQKEYFSVPRDQVFDNLTKFTDTLDELMAQNQVRMDSLENLARLINIILTLIAIIITGLIIYLITKNLVKALALLQVAFTEIAGGKLTEQVPVRSHDELGELAKAFNKMSSDLNRIVKEVIDTASSLAAASEELAASAGDAGRAGEQVTAMIGQLDSGAIGQAQSVAETRATIKQLAANSSQVVENTEHVSQSSEKVVRVAESGVVQAENAVRKIEEIREVTVQTAAAVALLGERSLKIGRIVDVIKGIADQTNLLALNAAIEAARAGEQGRGFAVVAEEVRKLAEQSSASAQQIALLIGDMQRETERVVQGMEKGKHEVAAGVETVNLTGSAFHMIVAEINVVVGQMHQVSTATQQMAAGISQVVQAVDNIAGIAGEAENSTQEASAASEEQQATMESIGKAAEELAKLGERLMGLVGKFEV
ncbi:HAMP domain-containing methyl-accepting chemotaxis protein [Desulfosporosinus sp. PR]|uniref:methyl-accepting chemotaxis protein n=1 Tax=Candidatus Desulfosporosinus nitrosoreducens TaxID=3401928 RepID=UPI0027FA553F|nr:HAMP domain-containing methyl-accepting chemotaxis protein [Desulfosporosinus sp. PR]MDQ7095128.1 HAMP domain-containing methyl-accepting chemotaxis protein [Desulfosporosinus sp. PR]